MRRQLTNSIYGLLDYAAYPIGMLIVAPFVLRNLGVAQYGIWAVTTSIVSIGSIVASGFGDANTQKIASHRSAGSSNDLLDVVRAAMGIHLVLGIAGSFVIWSSAGFLAGRLTLHDTGLYGSCVWCIRIAALVTALRALETVCISTQKAFERYGPAVRISITARAMSLVVAAALASRAQGIASIMAATAALTALGLTLQILGLYRLLGGNIAPSYRWPTTSALLRFGAFTWMLAASGVVFSQADRLIGGTSLGASAVVSYAICAQLSQPVYGLTAAGLHFLFPYIASRQGKATAPALRRTITFAVLVNFFIVLVGVGLLLILSDRLLHLLATDEIARVSASLLPSVLAGSGLLALSVTGSYAMIALNRVRIVAVLNVAASAAIVLFTTSFLHGFGVMALALGRIVFALIALCVYVPLARELQWRNAPVKSFVTREATEGA